MEIIKTTAYVISCK